jgi:hypothetical protein
MDTLWIILWLIPLAINIGFMLQKQHILKWIGILGILLPVVFIIHHILNIVGMK